MGPFTTGSLVSRYLLIARQRKRRKGPRVVGPFRFWKLYLQEKVIHISIKQGGDAVPATAGAVFGRLHSVEKRRTHVGMSHDWQALPSQN